ncbi:MAG: hypothetical protein IJA12_07760, partial [Oscillospiraceae bacterium]|nr:hypothetical protein [Oscillospiraceae bacterium]
DVGFSLSKKSSVIKLKVLIKLFQKFAGSRGRATRRRPQTAKYSIEGAFTRGELTKQPGGVFFKRGRFARKSVPLLWSYSNLPADLIGTKLILRFLNKLKPTPKRMSVLFIELFKDLRD